MSNELYNNASNENGGAIYNTSGNTTITDSAFIDNQATDGGAIYVKAGSATITDGEFRNNQATNGGAIFNGTDGVLNIRENVTFENNSANGNYGGAIYFNHGSLYVNNCYFRSKLAN